MTLSEVQELLTGRCKNSRKLANNTYLQRRGDEYAVKLHNTDILTYKEDGSIVLNTGGWFTPTTKDRINQFAPVHLTQKNFTWLYTDGTPFTDGDIIEPDGTINSQYVADDAVERKKLLKKIKKYSKEFSDW